MTDRPRILFYAVNGLGVGHVTRLLAIARQLRRLRADAEIVFLSSSEADSIIYREGFVAFKVPSKTAREEGGLQIGTYTKLIQTTTWAVCASFDPHLLVVDTFPAGAMQELLPLLRWPARKAFVYRAQRAERAMAASLQYVLPLYDRILIPHDAHEEFMPLAPEAESRAVWVGPILIRDREELLDRTAARQFLQLPAATPALLATLGGGGDDALAEMAPALRELAGTFPQMQLVQAQGPLLRSNIPETDGMKPVSVFPMLPYLPAFDLAIATAGYNTTNELVFAGIPAILLARDRRFDDQQARARRLAQQGACLYLPSPEPGALARAVAELLEPARGRAVSHTARAAIPENGARRAAECLLELLP